MTAVEIDPERAARKPPVEPVRQILVDMVPTLRKIARGLCSSSAEVEDLVQDTLEKALRSIETVNVNHNPRGWMVIILHNLHIDRCRQRARRLPHVPCDDVAIAAPEAPAAPAWYDITVDELRRAVTQLPEELREPYVMFALDGKSYIEVAAALQIPKATVGTRLLRARAQLKKILTARLGMEAI